MTLTATLALAGVPPGGSIIGKDAEADTVELPKTVAIAFSQTAATVEALDPIGGTAYGTSFNFPARSTSTSISPPPVDQR